MPALTPDNIQIKIDVSRAELLDLTMRNPLLNYRPLKMRGVEVVGAQPEAIYPLLVTHGKKFSFAPARAPGDMSRADSADARDSQPVATLFPDETPASFAAGKTYDDFFRRLDGDETVPESTPVFDVAAHVAPIPEPTAETEAQAKTSPLRAPLTVFETAYAPAELNRRLLNTLLTQRTFIEEQGVNTLFLALGMLTWRESGINTGPAATSEGVSSDKQHRSPLILVPVQIERAGIGDRFTLRYSDEDVIGNVSLTTYLAQNFRLELPPLPEHDDVDVARYLEQVALIVGRRDGWEVDTGAIALAFFSFNKYLMYKELEDALWPDGREPKRHAVLTALLGGGFHEASPRLGENDPLDRALSLAATKTVVEADGSQALAIEAVKQGLNLVIQGPPGTGKSQSITNIIAEAMGQGKTVLFVSEKMAALEVVKRRMDAVGLGNACLELHSHKMNKKAVLAELKRTLSLSRPVESPSAADDLHRLESSRDRLNAYCDAVNATVAASGWTPHTLYGQWLRLKAAYPDTELPPLELPATLTAWTSRDYTEREEAAAELQGQVASMGAPPAEHPFWGSAQHLYVSTDGEDFRRTFADARDRTAALQSAGTRLAEGLGLRSPATVGETDALAAAVKQAIAAPEHSGMQFTSGQWLARRADLAATIELGSRLTALKGRWNAILAPEAWDSDVRETRQAIADHGGKWYKFLLGDWRNARNALRLLCTATPPGDMAVQLELLDAVLEYRRTRTPFAESSALAALLFGAQWRGEQSDWPVLTKLLVWIVQVHQEVGDGRLPKAFLDFLSGAPDLKTLAPQAASVGEAAAAYREAVRRAVERLSFREEVRFGPGGHLSDVPLTGQETLFASWANNTDRLQQMAAFNHRAERCETLDLAPVVRLAATAERGGDRLLTAFQRAYCQSLLRQVFTASPDLANFNGQIHQQTADQFRALDRTFLKNNRADLASQHYEEIDRINGSIGGGAEGQVRILKREFEKKARHLPIRQLLEKAGNAIQGAKPVFMMSPLSVATFLAPGLLKFDLVVFDEASQVKPVDALGALARGAQAVVVGDSNQLPPSSFFDSLAQSDGVPDEDNETADMESILGLFVGQGAPQQMLRWHYRSRHESLIAVSNQEFYDGKLVIFPSPDAARERLGLTYRHLPETVYHRSVSGTNPREAKAVAEAAIEHARGQISKPHEEWHTLGIAAFSMAQMQAIWDAVENIRRLNPDTEPFFTTPAKNEPFFVKNLENVQGDERDVIFISVGYGRDKEGAVSVNFGPLNKAGGERRLNVLITRARLRCEVFTNLRPEDIDLSRSAARGVHAFKTFLAYAQSTDSVPQAAGSARTAHEPAADFESVVLDALQKRGYCVEAQVGCSGYFVDLAVTDPAHPGRYVLGIECDGPNYRSARWARDRDRLRDEVLVKMGWRLHRIWSTDWIHRPEDELRKLVEVVESALAAEVAQVKQDAIAAPPAPEAHPELVAVAAPSAHVAPAAQPYVVADLSRMGRLDVDNRDPWRDVVAMVIAVVTAESPIHPAELSRRIGAAMGVGRVTENFQAKVGTAASIAERAGAIGKRGTFWWNPATQAPTLRNRGDLDARFRNIEWISPEEIALAVRQVVGASYGLPFDSVSRSACRLLGLERVTGDTVERVNTVVRAMETEGILITVGGIVTLA